MRALSLLFVLLILTGSVSAQTDQDVRIPARGVELAGTLILPPGSTHVPCVLLVGGTLSQTRDGGFNDPRAAFYKRDALLRIAQHLAKNGYASLRWDRRGHGRTPAQAGMMGITEDASDVQSALQFARKQDRIGPVIIAGESAGAYYACLAAADENKAEGYIFLGALCSTDYEELYAYNYGRLKDYADQSVANRAWAEKNAPYELALGVHYKALFAAARRGDSQFTIRNGSFQRIMDLDRIRDQARSPLDILFKRISSPTLILQGEYDLNVPPEHALKIERTIKSTGNLRVRRVMVPKADHNFQVGPENADERFRERYTLASLKRPYSPVLYSALTDWLQTAFPVEISTDTTSTPPTPPLRDGIVAWNGIRVVENVLDAHKNPGVETLEGRIGPLLTGDGSAAHYIDMPAGMYLAEHPHSTESLIYTFRGEWVLCNGGRRMHMKPGSLFWFKANEPTGWEVPFDAPAYVLIFKGDRNAWSDKQFEDYLHGLAANLEKDQASGTPYLLKDLKPEHPARVYARKIHPEWEAKLPRP